MLVSTREGEGRGEEFGEGGGGGLGVGTGEDDEGGGWGEFGDGLAAGSAGLAGGVVEVGDDHGAKTDGGAELCYSARDRGLFSACGEAVGGVFDVAAGDDLSCFQQDGGSNEEAAVGSVGAVGGGGGQTGEHGELGGGDELRVGLIGHVC